jgi:hypothetical protein
MPPMRHDGDDRTRRQVRRMRRRRAQGSLAVGRPSVTAAPSIAQGSECLGRSLRRLRLRRSVLDNRSVPRISAFYGIVVTMYWRDHPPPHFHAAYSGDVAEIAIDTLEVIDGWLPPRALRLVIEWAALHREDLLENWTRARAHERLVTIDPLP